LLQNRTFLFTPDISDRHLRSKSWTMLIEAGPEKSDTG